MPAKLQLDGKLFGRLTVIGQNGKSLQGKVKWSCRCECGNICNIIGSKLINGTTTSCGCRKKEAGRENGFKNKKHGYCPSSGGKPTFITWSGMLTRCFNPKHKYFHYYGGRGITVCDRWKNSFENFLQDMGDRPEGLTLDRIDNNGNYEPNNCRWVTMKEQCNNRSNNKKQSPAPAGKE